MTTLFRAMTTRDTRTENGMVTHSTSSNAVLDMFFKMGGSRTMSENDILNMFERALNENELLATKALFYNRDVRGGQGERRSFRIMFKFLCDWAPAIAKRNLHLVPEYGRWDDLFVAFGTLVEADAVDLILHALAGGDRLCAKWMPRENKAQGATAKFLMMAFDLTPKQYRKLLAGETYVVENQMCSRKWGAINYNHVPSKAMNNYRKAFSRNDAGRFVDWLESLTKPETKNKINAGAIFPHDIVKRVMSGDSVGNVALEAQWKALPNYMPEGRMILPVCDVSGTMAGNPMDVCLALGIYLSERNTGPFKDGFITFSESPELQILAGSLQQRIKSLKSSRWMMNTDLRKVFELILRKALESKLSPDEMPQDILILSDMQFDQCVNNPTNTAMDMIRRIYTNAGYSVPNVIFWNLRTSDGIPAKVDERGTALISGFSPSIMKSLLAGDLTPMRMMLAVLESERYSKVT